MSDIVSQGLDLARAQTDFALFTAARSKTDIDAFAFPNLVSTGTYFRLRTSCRVTTPKTAINVIDSRSLDFYPAWYFRLWPQGSPGCLQSIQHEN